MKFIGKIKEQKRKRGANGVCHCVGHHAYIYSHCRILKIKIIAKGVRDGVQSSVIRVVTNNWDNNFNGLRQGYAGGYTLGGFDWNSDIDNGAIYAELSNLLGLQRNGSKYVKYAGGQEEYAIYNLSVNVRNIPFRGNENDAFSVDAYIVLRVPLEFGWGHLPDMIIRQKVRVKFIHKL